MLIKNVLIKSGQKNNCFICLLLSKSMSESVVIWFWFEFRANTSCGDDRERRSEQSSETCQTTLLLVERFRHIQSYFEERRALPALAQHNRQSLSLECIHCMSITYTTLSLFQSDSTSTDLSDHYSDHYSTGHQFWYRLLAIVLIALIAIYVHLFGFNKSVVNRYLGSDSTLTESPNNLHIINEPLIPSKTWQQFVPRRRQMVEVVDHRMDMNYNTSQDGYMEQEEEWEREGLLYAIHWLFLLNWILVKSFLSLLRHPVIPSGRNNSERYV